MSGKTAVEIRSFKQKINKLGSVSAFKMQLIIFLNINFCCNHLDSFNIYFTVFNK